MINYSCKLQERERENENIWENGSSSSSISIVLCWMNMGQKMRWGWLGYRREREAWNSGRLLGVENEKRRDDHEGYHEPHHTFIVLFTSRAFHTNSQSELPLSLLPNSPFPLSIFLSILSLSLSKFIYSSTYGYFFIFHLYSSSTLPCTSMYVFIPCYCIW
jgi:hypothetical protein